MIHHCQIHTGICWDDRHILQCPKCTLIYSIGYIYLGDLRSCRNHDLIAVYDKDFGCQVCRIEGKEASDQPKTTTSGEELDNKIKELQGQVSEIRKVRTERELERTGDHGRPDEGGAGYRWL